MLLKRTEIGIFILAMLLIGVVFVASASADSGQDTLSKDTIFEFNDSNSQSMPLPDFGPQTYDNLRKDPTVLATKGTIPQYTTQEERQKWLGKLDNVRVLTDDYLNSEVSNVNFDYYHEFFGLNSYGNTVIARYGNLPVLETMEQKKSWNSTLEELSNKIKDTIAYKYMYPHGQVVTCGVNTKGYFIILFKYGSVDKPLINEIYALIDNSARGMGILDIPVEFGYGTYFKSDVPLSPDVKDLSESKIHFIEEDMKQKHEPVYKGGDIANYGTIPLFKDENEYNMWAHKLYLIYERIGKKIDAYMDKGQLRSFGLELTRLQVGIPENISSEE